MSDETIHVRNNTARQRYEIELNGRLAVLQYRDAGRVRTFLHTEVPEELEGHGIASVMAKTALDEAQAAGLTIMPLCPFVRRYIDRHPEYKPLVKH